MTKREAAPWWAAPLIRCCRSVLDLLRPRRLRRRGALAGIEVVPVEDRVEPHRERALGLPPPEGTDGEHHDVTLADRLVNELSTALQRVATLERARQEHVLGLRRELHHH